MEYIILRGDTFDELVAIVNNHIQERWEPIGGVSFKQLKENVFIVVQAMTRVTEPANGLVGLPNVTV